MGAAEDEIDSLLEEGIRNSSIPSSRTKKHAKRHSNDKNIEVQNDS